MNALRPKLDFQKSSTEYERFRGISNDPLVHRAAMITLAELSLKGMNLDEIRGANAFLHEFLNLAEKDEEPKRLPVRALKTYGPPEIRVPSPS